MTVYLQEWFLDFNSGIGITWRASQSTDAGPAASVSDSVGLG